jgi:CRP-like cAMP-binding protein
MTPTPSTNLDLDDLGRFQVSGKAGDFLFKEGDGGAELFIVQHGQVEVLKAHGDTHQQVVVLTVGDVFGEDGVFGDGPRLVSVRGVTDFGVLKIDAGALDQIVREDSGVAVAIMRQLAVRSWSPRAAVPEQAPAVGSAVPVAPEPAGPPRIVLSDADRTFHLADLEQAVVGRLNRATGATPEIDLTDFDTERSLSRRHALIVQREGCFYVREEKKTQNGTFVNSRRVKTGVDVALADGDRLRFGLVKAVFRG